MLFPSSQQVGEPPRVVITGLGIITAHGLGYQTNLEGFRSGTPVFRPVTTFDASRQRVKTAAEVSFPEKLPPTRLTPSQTKRLDRASRLLLLAAHEAWNQSGWEPSDNLPLVLGTTSGGMTLGEAFYRQATTSPNSGHGQAVRILHYQAQRQALDLADAFGFAGPITIIGNACASGANAIGHAWEMLRTGKTERVLTGGYDGLSQLVFAGFDALQALSTTSCRPFDANRDGLALGEGAAVLTLETLAHAQKRGAQILGEMIGYGASTDSHHLTQPHPEGDAALAAMEAATRAARITPDQVDYINAHGTGTPLNDSAEAAAINRWAGSRTSTLAVSSTKSSIGHLLGAAGAVEAVIALMAVREQFLPPTITIESPDPRCTFQVVSKPAESKVNCALSNSFGFGGANASVIFRRWQ